MPGDTSFEVHEANTQVLGTASVLQVQGDRRSLADPWRIGFTRWNGLSPWNLNALPPEEAGIHGPRPRSEHRQCGAQSPEQDVYPRIVGMREREEYLSQRKQHTRDRCPETDQQQRSGARRHQLQKQVCQNRRRQESCNPILNGWNRCCRSQEYEPGSWPTLRKCREKPLHNRSRSQAIDIRKTSKP
jgi:hypothetical protein